MGRHSPREDKGGAMTRDERHRWLFADKDGQTIKFTQEGMPFRILKDDAHFGGVVHIGDTKCRIRIIRNQRAEKGKRNEVHFPDFEWRREETDGRDGLWTNEVADSESTLVGYMEIAGNWKTGEGKCIFHPVDEKESNRVA